MTFVGKEKGRRKQLTNKFKEFPDVGFDSFVTDKQKRKFNEPRIHAAFFLTFLQNNTGKKNYKEVSKNKVANTVVPRTLTSICTWHKDSSGTKQTTMQSPLTFKHLCHGGTKVSIPAEK